ncbi:TonB-dependent receptor plug domain-containing protein [Pelomonas sp. SE-A7]|uniref:TonB-dependent receptor n=1 Tax=Pelomonas sp. SE-A7 TaxID=3054953 RepID=UPI00259CD900|nr:TonB-dependent receptor plug domain-containing protein [Pelomonas sp. SE-A7]MDM4766986.1 TonB-dependent receptor [Pelomonas sp. SE-A7]
MSYIKRQTRKRLARSLVAAAVGTCLAGIVMAQSTTGSVHGSLPAGTVVVLTSNTGVTRTVTAGADGRFSVANLQAGSYKIEAKGIGTREVTVTIGGGTDVSFANTLETVTVSGTRISKIDVSQTDTRTVFTADALTKIAVGQSVNQVALLAPGVINSNSYNLATGGNDTPLGRAAMANIGSFGGSAASENAYYINGFSVTNPLTNMGATTLPFAAIGQMQVLTGGYGAEFGRSTGGVVNVLTKAGTNEWKGGVYAVWAPAALRSAPKDLYYANTGKWSEANHYNTTAGNNKDNWTDGTLYSLRSLNKLEETKVGGYVSGPIIKDKLFIFANAEQTTRESEGVRIRRIDTLTATNAAQAWGETRTQYPRAAVKVDWNITDNHLLEVTGVKDGANEQFAYYGFDYNTLTRNKTKFNGLNGDHVLDDKAELWVAKYTGNLTDNFSVAATFGQQKIRHNPDPLPGYDATKTYVSISPTTVPAQYKAITNPQPYGSVTDPGQDKTTGYRLDLTYHLGKHELRFGVDHFKADSTVGDKNSGPGAYTWTYALSNDPTAAVSAGYGIGSPASGGGLGAQGYYVTQNLHASGGTVSTEQHAIYVEDRWQATKNLLLSLGIRNDSFTNYNGDHQPYAKQKNNRGPRMGAVWDVNGDASLKTFANFGRYFLALPNNVAIRGANASLGATKYYTYTGIGADGAPTGLNQLKPAAGSAGLCPDGTPGAGATSENSECGKAPDPSTVAIEGLKAHYQDELILGFEQALNKQWSWGSKFTYRDLKNSIDDVCVGSVCRIFNPGQAATFLIPQADGTIKRTSYTAEEMRFPKLKRKLVALDLFAEYQDGRTFGKLEYTLSRNYGNAEGQLDSSGDTGNGGQPDVSVTAQWDIPEIMEGSDGLLPNNRTHQIKAFGSYKLNSEWRVGGSTIIQSGRPNYCRSLYPYAKKGIYNGAYYNFCGVAGAQTATDKPGTAPNADYRSTPHGTLGNTPWTKTFNLNVTYTPEFLKGFSLQADIQNLFNTQTATAYSAVSASSRTAASSTYNRVIYYTDPRTVRFTGRYDF